MESMFHDIIQPVIQEDVSFGLNEGQKNSFVKKMLMQNSPIDLRHGFQFCNYTTAINPIVPCY